MLCHCCICDEEVDLSLDEFIELDQEEDRDVFCDECAWDAIRWITEMLLRKN